MKNLISFILAKIVLFWNYCSGQTHWSWHFFLGFAIFAWAISFLLETRRWNCVSMTKLSTFLPAQNLNILVVHQNPAWLKLKLWLKGSRFEHVLVLKIWGLTLQQGQKKLLDPGLISKGQRSSMAWFWKFRLRPIPITCTSTYQFFCFFHLF